MHMWNNMARTKLRCFNFLYSDSPKHQAREFVLGLLIISQGVYIIHNIAWIIILQAIDRVFHAIEKN
jgi:hypothetical protein